MDVHAQFWVEYFAEAGATLRNYAILRSVDLNMLRKGTFRNGMDVATFCLWYIATIVRFQ